MQNVYNVTYTNHEGQKVTATFISTKNHTPAQVGEIIKMTFGRKYFSTGIAAKLQLAVFGLQEVKIVDVDADAEPVKEEAKAEEGEAAPATADAPKEEVKPEETVNAGTA